MQPHQKLLVWRRAHEFTLLVFRIPPMESPACREAETRLRRVAVAIAAHISDGVCRGKAPQFVQQLECALRGAREASYLILLLADLEELSTSTHAKLEARVDEITRMLVGLLRTVRKRRPTPLRPSQRITEPGRTHETAVTAAALTQ